jgi:hypothetical protein
MCRGNRQAAIFKDDRDHEIFMVQLIAILGPLA